MRLLRLCLTFSMFAICTSLALPQSIWGAEANNLRVGVAKVDITPKDMTGIAGVSNRDFSGVREPIYVRALVLEDGTTTAAIIGIDFVEYGNTMPLRQRIAQELGIPADHIMIAPSHDHSAPRGGPVTPGTSSATQGRPRSTAAYTKQAEETIVDTVRKAKAAMQPARMGAGTGQADVNVYRYALVSGRWRAGVNPDGPMNKTLWVVKFETLSGEPIALLMNYAVHSNVLTGSPDNNNMIAGDISGTAERYVETHYQDKIVAIWTMGAAADQYPKFNKEMDRIWDKTPGIELAEIQGKTLGLEAIQTARRITEMTPVVHIRAGERVVPCPLNVASSAPPAGGLRGAGGPGGQAADGRGPAKPAPQLPPDIKLQQPKPGDTLNLYLGLIRINEIAITSVSGEVSTNIFSHLKRLSPFNDLIMATLVNDRAGYIPDEANWERMGAAFERGCAEPAIVNNLLELMKSTM
jgi:neutral ceramidase